jgi:hypothetical protein
VFQFRVYNFKAILEMTKTCSVNKQFANEPIIFMVIFLSAFLGLLQRLSSGFSFKIALHFSM